MSVILVTGKSGVGKSTISMKLAKVLGYNYLGVDKVSHEIYNDKDMLNKTMEMFGNDIFGADGKVDRKKLGKLVFNEPDKAKVQAFNDMAWEYIQSVVDKRLNEDIVIDWLLSPVTKYWDMADYRILVRCPDDDMRFNRIMNRDNITLDYVKSRDKASLDFSKYTYDYTVINTDSHIIDHLVEDIVLSLGKK